MGRSRGARTLVPLAVLLTFVVWGFRGAGAAGVPSRSVIAGTTDIPTVTRTATPTTTGGHYRSPTPTTTPVPWIFEVTPASGPAVGGTQAAVTGANFQFGATATIGGLDAQAEVQDAAHIQISSPPLPPASLYAVKVTNPDGHSQYWTGAWFAEFLDVSSSNPFHDDVEWLFRMNWTVGCGGGRFCPDAVVTRAQAAVFLVKALTNRYYVPPPCESTIFSDVPCPGGPNVDWINWIASYGVTGGCGGGNYCPSQPVTRAQIAVLLLKSRRSPVYEPPSCDSTVFADVPCSDGAYVDWINDLAASGITAGCGGNLYCPTGAVSRGQMATLIIRTFIRQ